MTTLYLIRHGLPTGGSDVHDPSLTQRGRDQALLAAQSLADRGPLPVITSPLRRTRETAREFEAVWRLSARIEPRVAEIPSPGMTLEERAAWIKTLHDRRWRDLDSAVQRWHREIVESVLELSTDTVVVTHFMVINALLGWATGEERIVCAQPLQGSRTTLERVGGSFRVVEVGAQGSSTVL